MGKILKDAIVHQREVTVTFTAHELREIIVREAMQVAGADVAPLSVKLVVRQEEEGSPSYRVDRWNASVDLIIKR